MAVNYNGQHFRELPEHLVPVSRAIFYGDMLFETIRVFDDRLPFLDRHWSRLEAGLRAMGFVLPAHWNAAFFERQIRTVATTNARVRLSVWRAPGGLYLPENNDPQFLISSLPLEQNQYAWPETGLVLGVSDRVRLPVDTLSNFKTLNAPRYIAAAHEARDCGWDDALLLNCAERVCEATSSNVFWWEGSTLCTVPLSEGCVAGVFRAELLEIVRSKGFVIQEIPVTFANLQAADEIFLTNAIRGIVPVRIFAGKTLANLKTKRLFDTLTTQDWWSR